MQDPYLESDGFDSIRKEHAKTCDVISKEHAKASAGPLVHTSRHAGDLELPHVSYKVSNSLLQS